MKKRKGLIALIVVCVASLIATIGLGIACTAAFNSGLIRQALNAYIDRYRLSVLVDVPEYAQDYYDSLPSVQTPDADNRIDLSVIPQGSDLKIECDDIALTVRSGDTAAAQLTLSGEAASVRADQYRFELFRSYENSSRYILVFYRTAPLQANVQDGAYLDVTLPNDWINRLDVESGNGNVTLSGIGCPILTAESDNGSLTAESLNIGKRVDLSAENGSLTLRNLQGSAVVYCETDNGSIQFSLGSLSSYFINASADNGEIINNLVTPARTIYGDDLRYQSPGADGPPDVTLFFHAENGQIELNP